MNLKEVFYYILNLNRKYNKSHISYLHCLLQKLNIYLVKQADSGGVVVIKYLYAICYKEREYINTKNGIINNNNEPQKVFWICIMSSTQVIQATN